MAIAFDIVILAIAVALGFSGAMSGLINGAFRFLAMLAGFIVAFMFYRDLESLLVHITSTTAGNTSAIIAFLLVFVIASSVVLGIGRLLHELAKSVSLGWLDRLLGAVLGGLMAGIIAWAACLSISSMPLEVVQKQFKGSVVYGAYGHMPRFFSLEGMEDFRDTVRGTKSKRDGKPEAIENKGRGGKNDAGSGEEDYNLEDFDSPLKKKLKQKKKAPQNKGGATEI